MGCWPGRWWSLEWQGEGQELWQRCSERVRCPDGEKCQEKKQRHNSITPVLKATSPHNALRCMTFVPALTGEALAHKPNEGKVEVKGVALVKVVVGAAAVEVGARRPAGKLVPANSAGWGGLSGIVNWTLFPNSRWCGQSFLGPLSLSASSSDVKKNWYSTPWG